MAATAKPKEPTDRWSFYVGDDKDWHWRRTSVDGRSVDASAASFKVRAACEDDARRNGWRGW
jgi:hypothetical protein